MVLTNISHSTPARAAPLGVPAKSVILSKWYLQPFPALRLSELPTPLGSPVKCNIMKMVLPKDSQH